MPTDDQDGKKTGDDAEKIWAAIRDQPVVPPNPDARNRALQAGLAAFDAIIEKKHQGFHSRVRLTSMMTHFFQTIGDLTMNTRTILSMAGVAAAVLLVVATVVAPPFNSESWHNPLAYLKNLQSSYEQTVKAESSAKPNLSWPLQEKNQPRSPQGSRVAPPPRSSQVADSPQSGQVAPLPQPSQVADSLQVADERPQRRREPLARMALVEAETVQKRAPMPAAAPPGKSDQTHLGTTGSVAGQRHRQYAGAPAQARQKTARFMSGRANHQKEERGAELFRFSPSQPHAIAESLPATEQMDADRDRFAAFETNPVRVTREHPVSTFSVDVDTAAYANVREFDAAPVPAAPRVAPAHNLRAHVTRRDYERAVAAVIEHICAGDIFQANLTQPFTADWGGDPRALFWRLCEQSPAPFCAYVDDGRGTAVLSSSPEEFLFRDGDFVRTRPIKGTRPRAAGAAADRALLDELLASEKDRAELAMIVDLLRNDLGKVAATGSVGVGAFPEHDSFAQVHHLFATVEARLRPEVSTVELLRATFPGGSITGCPKLRCLELLEGLEWARRGVYTGAIGWFGPGERMHLNVAIRTLVHRAGRVRGNAGGGITALSEPSAEWQESIDKMEGLRRALQCELPSAAEESAS